jgi:hypothetical protein
MKKEKRARTELPSSLSETIKERKETDSLTSVLLADSPLDLRKREASKPLYLTRYE